MSHLRIVRGSAHNEISYILQSEKDLLEIMLEDKVRRQQFEKLKAQLQKDSTKKKEYNDEVNAVRDISAHLKQIKLSILFNAQKEEILKALAIDTLYFADAVKLKKLYVEDALAQQKQYKEIAKTNHHSPDLIKAKKLLEDALQKEAQLQGVISQFNLLQEKMNNWETQEWRPTVTAAAKIAAQAISVQVSVDLASNPVYQALSSALEDKDNNNLSIIAEKQQEMEANIAEALGNRASVDNLIKFVPGLQKEIIAKNKDTNNAEQKKAVIAEVIEPVYKLCESIILAANLRIFYKHIQEMCVQHGLSEQYKKELSLWNALRLAKEHTNNTKYQKLLNGYHNNIKSAYNSHVDDHVQLYQLATEGEKAKTSFISVMDQLKELTPNAEEQPSINLRRESRSTK